MLNDYFDRAVLAVETPLPTEIDTGGHFWRMEDPVIEYEGENKIIKVGGLFLHQRQWWNLKNFIVVLVAGYGCIAGDTKILDPVTGKEESAAELCRRGRPIRVLSLMPDGSTAIRWATAPFLKGRAKLYRVTLTNGDSVCVTSSHRFATPFGWKKLSSLRLGHAIACLDSEQPPILNERQKFQTIEDWKEDCSPCFCRCGERLLEVRDSDQEPSPLQVDVRRCNQIGRHEGGWASKSSRNLCLSCFFPALLREECSVSPSGVGRLLPGSKGDQPSFLQTIRSPSLCGESLDRWRSLGRYGLSTRVVDEKSRRIPKELDELCYGSTETSFGCRLGCRLACKSESSDELDEQEESFSFALKNHSRWVKICNIQALGVDNFYDLTVPGPANYLAQGIWHHNSGKTNVNCKRAIASALENAPAPVAVVSPTHSIARNTVVSTIATLLGGKERLYGKHRFWWKYFKKDSSFRIRYQGRDGLIIIYSGEDPLSLRGPNLAAAYIDEPFIQDEEVFKQMVARVRHPAATRREIRMSGTPEEISNWGYDLCVGEDSKKHDIAFVRASTRNNLALPDDYVLNLEGAFDGKAARAYIDGEFENLAKGAVYYSFDPTDGVNVKDLPIPDDAELGCGMDFNVNPMAACMFWKKDQHMHYFDEIELANADTELMCEELRRKYVFDENRKTKQKLFKVYPDASGNFRKTSSPEGKTDFHYIRQAGFTIMAKPNNPKRKDRWNAVNGKFKPKVGQPSLTISSKCKKLIKYLSVASHERRNEKDQKKAEHLLDAFGYPVAYLFPIVYERPMKKIIGF